MVVFNKNQGDKVLNFPSITEPVEYLSSKCVLQEKTAYKKSEVLCPLAESRKSHGSTAVSRRKVP